MSTSRLYSNCTGHPNANVYILKFSRPEGGILVKYRLQVCLLPKALIMQMLILLIQCKGFENTKVLAFQSMVWLEPKRGLGFSRFVTLTE